MEQAEELAGRVAILAEGSIRAEGTPAELVREHFGDARELTVTLSEPPGDAARQALESFGLRPVPQGNAWSGRLTGGMEALSGLGGRLQSAGATVAELRVREPGLRGVFFRVTGREFES
jgi:ABC-2 type transport system ATP-binding protein